MGALPAIAAVWFAVSSAALAAAPDLSTVPAPAPMAPREGRAIIVERLAFSSGVESRMPVGEAASFPASAAQVYCWSLIRARRPPTLVKHVWKLDGRTMAEYTLDVRHGSSRIWSHKKVRPGLWRVDITDQDGGLIAIGAFPVGP